MNTRPLSAAAAAAFGLLFLQPAQSEVLHVLSAGAVENALKDLADRYGKAHGVDVDCSFGNVGMIEERLQRGEQVDVVILSDEAIDTLEHSGLLMREGTTPVGRVGLGLAIRAGAARPDISTEAALKATLLQAKSIAYSDPKGGGSSGVAFDRLVERFGIADAVHAKAVLIRGGSAADKVASGEAELAVQNVSELMHVPLVALVGPLPLEDQSYIRYEAAISSKSQQRDAAQGFLRALVAPVERAGWRAAGVEPPPR